ncbi:hypothetical protein ACETU7_03885 [Rhodococcus sp. 3Y1]
MAGAPDEVLLPVDRPRGSVSTTAVGSVPIVIDAATGGVSPPWRGAVARRSSWSYTRSWRLFSRVSVQPTTWWSAPRWQAAGDPSWIP